jgi:hypothetical protein
LSTGSGIPALSPPSRAEGGAGASPQRQLEPVQVKLQEAPDSQTWVQLPPPHEAVQDDPALQVCAQLPPWQLKLHAPPVQTYWQLPPAHDSVQPLQLFWQLLPLQVVSSAHDRIRGRPANASNMKTAMLRIVFMAKCPDAIARRACRGVRGGAETDAGMITPSPEGR